MALTREDNEKLKAPLPLEEGHELRVAESGDDWAFWLVYTEEDPVKERLDEVDPSWTWAITDKRIGADFATVYGTLTVNGVSRDCVGDGQSRKDGGKMTGDAEKGAATDALKRGARLFGVGLYLKTAPRISTKWAPFKKEDSGETKRAARKVQEQAKQEALEKFARWYRQQFGGAPSVPASKSDAARIIGRDEPPVPQPERPVTRAERSANDEPSERDAVKETPAASQELMTVPTGASGDEYDPSSDITPITAGSWTTFGNWLPKAGVGIKNFEHAANTLRLALFEAGLIGDKDISWGDLYKAGIQIAPAWAAIQAHYAAKPQGKAS